MAEEVKHPLGERATCLVTAPVACQYQGYNYCSLSSYTCCYTNFCCSSGYSCCNSNPGLCCGPGKFCCNLHVVSATPKRRLMSWKETKACESAAMKGRSVTVGFALTRRITPFGPTLSIARSNLALTAFMSRSRQRATLLNIQLPLKLSPTQ